MSWRPCSIFVATQIHGRKAAVSTHDCVRFVAVRGGSMFVRYEAEVRHISAGDVTLIAPGVVTEWKPEDHLTTTTLFADADYLIEHLFWQHLDLIPDRDAARSLAAKLYPESVQVLRVGEREVERLEPILDELVTLTKGEQDAAGYFRTHALLFTVLEVIASHVRHAAVAVPPFTPTERAVGVGAPRWRVFRPVRSEAARSVALMSASLAKRWHVKDLAAQVCLSTSQFTRVFRTSFGVTPMAYLAILRVLEMARLLRETNDSIATISERVGWAPQDGQASRVFRRHMGTSPITYRRHGPPRVSENGPGVAGAQAAKSANESAKQPVGRRIWT